MGLTLPHRIRKSSQVRMTRPHLDKKKWPNHHLPIFRNSSWICGILTWSQTSPKVRHSNHSQSESWSLIGISVLPCGIHPIVISKYPPWQLNPLAKRLFQNASSVLLVIPTLSPMTISPNVTFCGPTGSLQPWGMHQITKMWRGTISFQLQGQGPRAPAFVKATAWLFLWTAEKQKQRPT